ncbi:MAG: hypothetical protein RL078_1217 [Bacteroidota bacterium]|jgi:hypothetical protein
MTELVTIIKKYGVTGVLCVWLWHTENRLTKVEQALYDCYKESTIRNSTNSSYKIRERLVAIMPNDEKTNKRHTQA